MKMNHKSKKMWKFVRFTDNFDNLQLTRFLKFLITKITFKSDFRTLNRIWTKSTFFNTFRLNEKSNFLIVIIVCIFFSINLIIYKSTTIAHFVRISIVHTSWSIFRFQFQFSHSQSFFVVKKNILICWTNSNVKNVWHIFAIHIKF